MTTHQINIPAIPAAIVLNADTKQVAFNKNDKVTFIDVIGNLPVATWKIGELEIGGTTYKYNTWIAPSGALKEYLKVLIQKDGVPPMFGFM